MMEKHKLKLKIQTFIEGVADKYFCTDNIQGRLMNATSKWIIESNIYKIDPILDMFADQNGMIDCDRLYEVYSAALFKDGNISMDARTLIPDEYNYLKSLMPDKIVILTRDDLKQILMA